MFKFLLNFWHGVEMVTTLNQKEVHHISCT